MGDWKPWSRTRSNPHMHHGDFYHGEVHDPGQGPQCPHGADRQGRHKITVLKPKVALREGAEIIDSMFMSKRPAMRLLREGTGRLP